MAPEEVPSSLRVAGFWSNPPIRIGKPALHELLEGWFDRLAPGGSAVLVVHKHLGADSLATWIERRGLAVRRIVSRGGFRILEATVTSDDASDNTHRHRSTPVKQLGSTDLKRLHRTWRHRTDTRVGLVLDRVTQPFNVGAILRTAAALRVDDLWLVADTPGPEVAKVGKTALGAERYLALHRVEDGGAAAVGLAGEAGYRTIGLELADGAVPMHELDLVTDTCLVVGHEDRGLTQATLDACDAVGYLPQLGKIGSLNVATATAVGALRDPPPGVVGARRPPGTASDRWLMARSCRPSTACACSGGRRVGPVRRPCSRSTI